MNRAYFAGTVLAIAMITTPGSALATDGTVSAAFDMWADREPPALSSRLTKCVVTRAPSCRALGRRLAAWSSDGRVWLENSVDGSETPDIVVDIGHWRTALSRYGSLGRLLQDNLQSRTLGRSVRAAEYAGWAVTIGFVVDSP